MTELLKSARINAYHAFIAAYKTKLKAEDATHDDDADYDEAFDAYENAENALQTASDTYNASLDAYEDDVMYKHERGRYNERTTDDQYWFNLAYSGFSCYVWTEEPVNTDFTMSVTKPFSFKDDQTFNLSYHTGPKKIPDIILGWENAGYVVTAIDERTYNGR